MDQIIAYGDDLIDRDIVDNVHKDIRISKDRFLDNALHLNKFWKDFQFSQLRVKVDPKTWLEHGDVSIVNAFYNDESNVIIFKAAFLQGVNFTNILRAAFLYESFAQSFFLYFHFRLELFWHQNIGANVLLKCWYTVIQMVNFNSILCTNLHCVSQIKIDKLK
jgi:hypothetical protein